jgi:hypothetical protein
VCVPKGSTKEQIEEAVNALHPTGIKSRWKISKDEKFDTGDPHPKQCEHSADRMHYLMVC